MNRKKNNDQQPDSSNNSHEGHSAEPEPSFGGRHHRDHTPSDDIAHNIQAARINFVNWQYGWGSETRWASEFNAQLSIAQKGGQDDVDRFFRACEGHVMAGWEILKDLKFVASVSCNSTPDEIWDLFLQGYEMVIATYNFGGDRKSVV